MAQGKIFEKFVNGRGSEVRDIGFLARCLVAFPTSTKGSRFLRDQPQSEYNLTTFQKRISEILIEDKLKVDQGRQSRSILEFSPEAKNRWIYFRNAVESNLHARGYLSDVDDFASKISNNLARMAALFHFFEGKEGNISVETLNCAIEICSWYIHEFKRLFAKKPEIPIEVSDAYELEQFLYRTCQNSTGIYSIQKSNIIQYGPSKLRKKSRLDPALFELSLQHKIQIRIDGKTHWIILNPNNFPVPSNFAQAFTPTVAYLQNNS